MELFDPKLVRSEFPFFASGPIYLDSAATAQKPKAVLDAMHDAQVVLNANVHRGVYKLADDATKAYEAARERVARFVCAKSSEIVFVRNATEAINLVALGWGEVHVKKGDTILLTEMEHHSNIVPWQLLAKRKQAMLAFVPITKDGRLDGRRARELLDAKPAIFAFTHVSNVLGTINPATELVALAKERGVPTLLDASQSVPHLPVDVKSIGCDFLVFSGHKVVGPHVGVLYARREILERLEPVLGGGDMIKSVTKDGATWNDVPWRFEAGTPNVPGAIGLGVAVVYLEGLGMANVHEHARSLASFCRESLRALGGITLYGPEDGLVVSFNVGDMHAHDVSTVLDEAGVCVRSGHHCAQPLMDVLGIPACVRASFGAYNTKEDVEALIAGVKKAKKVFGI